MVPVAIIFIVLFYVVLDYTSLKTKFFHSTFSKIKLIKNDVKTKLKSKQWLPEISIGNAKVRFTRGRSILISIIILLLTNPNINDFKNSIEIRQYEDIKVMPSKGFDCFLFSIYYVNYKNEETGWYSQSRYLGILKNFFHLSF